MCILTMKTMTQALRAKQVLATLGIDTDVVNIDGKLTAKGCAYGLRMECKETERAIRGLTDRNIPYGVVLGNKR